MRERQSHRYASLPSAISLLTIEQADDDGLVPFHFPGRGLVRLKGRTKGRGAFMKAYSQDLRERVLRAVDQGYPRAEIVQFFGVSQASIKQYLKQWQEEGHVRLKALPGRPPKKWAQVEADVLPQDCHRGERLSTAFLDLATHLTFLPLKKRFPNSKPPYVARQPEPEKPWKKPLPKHYSPSLPRMLRDGFSIADILFLRGNARSCHQG